MEVAAVLDVAGLESNPRSENTKQQSITSRAEKAVRKESALITDRWMQRNPASSDQWKTEEAPRGAGRLAARITPNGERLFYFRYTDQNRTQWRYPLGSYNNGESLKHARAEADRLSRLYQSGVRDIRQYEEARKRNEADQRQAAEEARKAAELQATAGTLRALLNAYVNYLECAGKPSAADVRRLVKLHLFDAHPALADRRAADLRARDLTPVLSLLVQAGKGRTAAKVRSFIRAACTLALRAETNAKLPNDFRGFALELNPADALDPLSEFNNAREDNDLKELDLREYLLALGNVPNAVVRFALEVSLYLGGQRAKQLLRVTPTGIDLDAGEITLRDIKGRRKKARLHKLPLTAHAAELIGEVLKQREKAPFLFSNDGKRACTVDTLGKAVAAISTALLKENKISKGFHLADMRATCETHMARLGVSKDLRAQIQSHGLGGIQARHYDKHDYMVEKRAALEMWGRYLDELKAGRRQLNVVEMRKRH
jgi:hypothetical protein